MIEGIESSLDFGGREEFNRLANPAGPSFLVLDAPHGYGKTHLLRQIERSYGREKKNPDHWICVYIDLAQPDTNKYAILKEISSAVAGKSAECSSVSMLATIISEHVKDVFILVDSVNSSDQNTIWLMEEMIPTLLTRINEMKYRAAIRVWFAGRYLSQKNWPSNYEVKQLSSIDFSGIQTAMLVLAPWLANPYARQYSRIIAFISGGHPNCIANILRDLAEKNNWDKIRDAEEQIRLYRDHVSETLKMMLDEVDDKLLKDALMTLSVFKRFNPKIIEALQEQDKISNSLPSSVLFDRLLTTGLVRAKPDDVYFSDICIRDLVTAEMCLGNKKYRQLFLDINQFACELYEIWLDSKQIGSNEQRQAIVISDSIYHLINCLKAKGACRTEIENTIGDKLGQYLPRLSSSFDCYPNEDLRQKVQKRVREDLSDLLEDLFGEDGAQKIYLMFTGSGQIARSEPRSSIMTDPLVTSASQREKQIHKKYENIIVAVVNENMEAVGTGFTLKNSTGNYVITCAHVLAEINVNEGDSVILRHYKQSPNILKSKVKWYRPPTNILPRNWSAEEDIAILGLDSPLSLVEDFELFNSEDLSEAKAGWCFGYTSPKGDWITGLSYENTNANNFVKLHQIGEIQVNQGASGAPVCVIRDSAGIIQGIIHAYKGDDPSSIFLIPSYLILKVLSNLATDQGG